MADCSVLVPVTNNWKAVSSSDAWEKFKGLLYAVLPYPDSEIVFLLHVCKKTISVMRISQF